MIHILCYHRVLHERDVWNEAYFARGTAVLAEHFEAHMRYIRERFEVLTDQDVREWLDASRSS